ncbi:MAG: aldehyde dehydrogenase family protein, partial [Pseudomonadota bacterium]
MQTKLLINGKFEDGAGEALDIHDPATGDTIAAIPEASPEQVRAATAAAAQAFESYSQTTPAERAAYLHQIADAFETASQDLAKLESQDCGKPWPSAHDDEFPASIDTYRFMAGAARTQSGSATAEYIAGATSMIRKDPVGPVASIAPWNYPFMMASWKLAAPLAAGCTVVLKPSEMTPLSTLAMAENLAEILPPGVVNILHGRGPSIGDALINDPAMEAISITGSPATGMAAFRAASQKIRHVHLELGGKAPVIVFDDADVEAVVETVRGVGFFNAGQDCAQPTRILAQPGIYDRLTTRLAEEVGKIKIGAPHDDGVEMGPLISAGQRDRVAGFVNRARDAAEIAVGGDTPTGSGYFYAPTVVANVDNNAEIARSEVFGPVITVSRVADAEEAIR